MTVAVSTNKAAKNELQTQMQTSQVDTDAVFIHVSGSCTSFSLSSGATRQFTEGAPVIRDMRLYVAMRRTHGATLRIKTRLDYSSQVMFISAMSSTRGQPANNPRHG